jgi:hypothetical protein
MRRRGGLPLALEDDRRVVLGVLITCALVLAQTAGQLIDYRFFQLRMKMIDSGGDAGVFGVIGDLALLFAAAATWFAAARAPDARRPLAILASLLAFLALDKALRLHDHIPHWLSVYLPVLLAVFFLLLGFARRTTAQARRLIIVALGLLTASFLIHQYGDSALAALHQPPTSLSYQLKGASMEQSSPAGSS